MRPSSTPKLLLAVMALSLTAAGLVAAAFGGLFPRERPAALSAAAPPPVSSPQHAAVGLAPLEHPRSAPDLEFIDGAGNAVTLAAFRGRVVLLNLWATWCVPCRKEMPTLDRLQAKLGSPDFQVIALSIDRAGVPAVKQFYQELGLKSLGVYVDQSAKAASRLDTAGLPTTLLIGRDGREVARKIGPAEWDSADVVASIRRYLEPGSNTVLSAGSASAGATTR